MPPPLRRKHLLPALTIIALLTLYYYYVATAPSRAYTSPYLTTLKRISAEERLRAELIQSAQRNAADAAKAAANVKAPVPPPKDAVQKGGDTEHTGEKIPLTGGFNAQEELVRILKEKIVVIFSKTYCPHSKDAKHILTEKYKINPPPFIVELDKHEHGPELQKALKDLSGRGTVPNVFVAGTSIGGGDDMIQLDKDGALIKKVRDLSGKRVVQIFKLKGVEK